MEDGLQVAEDEKGELCHLHPPFRTGPEWLGGPVEEEKRKQSSSSVHKTCVKQCVSAAERDVYCEAAAS